MKERIIHMILWALFWSGGPALADDPATDGDFSGEVHRTTPLDIVIWEEINCPRTRRWAPDNLDDLTSEIQHVLLLDSFTLQDLYDHVVDRSEWHEKGGMVPVCYIPFRREPDGLTNKEILELQSYVQRRRPLSPNLEELRIHVAGLPWGLLVYLGW